VCVNRTQVCVNRTQVCVNRTQGLIRSYMSKGGDLGAFPLSSEDAAAARATHAELDDEYAALMERDPQHGKVCTG
jgi:hypothetical protein